MRPHHSLIPHNNYYSFVSQVKIWRSLFTISIGNSTKICLFSYKKNFKNQSKTLLIEMSRTNNNWIGKRRRRRHFSHDSCRYFKTYHWYVLVYTKYNNNKEITVTKSLLLFSFHFLSKHFSFFSQPKTRFFIKYCAAAAVTLYNMMLFSTYACIYNLKNLVLCDALCNVK